MCSLCSLGRVVCVRGVALREDFRKFLSCGEKKGYSHGKGDTMWTKSRAEASNYKRGSFVGWMYVCYSFMQNLLYRLG